MSGEMELRLSLYDVGIRDGGDGAYWRVAGNEGPRFTIVDNGYVETLTEAIAAGVPAAEAWMAQPVGSGATP